MFRSLVVSLLLASSSAQLPAPAPGPSPEAPPRTEGARRTGIHGDALYLDGRVVAEVHHHAINCLGHASGVGSAVYVGREPLADVLAGLGYRCEVGGAATLAPAIASGADTMTVYLYAYPPAWRTGDDRKRDMAQMRALYRWTDDIWTRRNVFFDRRGHGLPIDYHAIGYDRSAGQWRWVGRARDKERDGAYLPDPVETNPRAVNNPDLYFDPRLVILSLACARPG